MARRPLDDDDEPDLGEVVGRVRGTLGRFFARFGMVLLGGVIVALSISGTYSVGPGEVAVVKRFGAENRRSGPGLHYAFPFVESATVVNVEKIQRIEVGIHGEERRPQEALMLTGDANIVEVQMIVQYRIAEPAKYLFRIRDAEDSLQATAEVALRSVVGRTKIDDVMTTGRDQIQVEARDALQRLMDQYQSGLAVTEVKLLAADAPDQVKEAFHAVTRAREEREKLINQAQGYRADKLPRARGEAQSRQREAEGYKEKRVLEAQGDASQFLSLLAEYQKAKDVTRERLHLEAMERILARVDKKILVDEAVARALPFVQGGGLLPPAAKGGP